MTEKTKEIWLRAGRVLLCVAAYGFLLWKLLTFKDYDALALNFRTAGIWQYLMLFAALLLVPVNVLSEAWKWQYLLRDLCPVSIGEAQRQVYFGQMGAVITPARLGDYPTRVLRLEEKYRLPAVMLGFVGSFALSLVMILVGLIALMVAGIEIAGVSNVRLAVCALVVCVSILLLCLYAMPRFAGYLSGKGIKNENLQLLLRTMAALEAADFLHIVLISSVRYLVYCLQLWLVMQFCGIGLSLHDYELAVPIYYMVLTLIPSFSLADIAVRGSVSIIVFSAFTGNTASVALAAMIVWILNTLLPTLIGSFIRRRKH